MPIALNETCGLRRNYVVFDTPNRPYHDNKVFDPLIARKYPGALALCRFHEIATREGYTVLTTDRMEKDMINPQDTIMLTEQWSPDTERLIAQGSLPGILFCLETLWHAWAFYRNLRKTSARYRHVFLLPGARNRIDEAKTCFHPIFFPQRLRQVVGESNLSWEDKRYLTMINSNIPPLKGLRYRIACLIDPDLRSELYTERLRAIKHFSENPGFHLYGRGWKTRCRKMPIDFHLAAVRSYKGACSDKISTLAKYRFAVCFENTRFPGYITEKIFDCFFAGCIPIYYGAPDIEKYVPKETFIDFREFEGYADLDKYLVQMTSDKASSYLEAAKTFLASKAFDPFYQDHFASELVSALNACNDEPEVV